MVNFLKSNFVVGDIIKRVYQGNNVTFSWMMPEKIARRVLNCFDNKGKSIFNIKNSQIFNAGDSNAAARIKGVSRNNSFMSFTLINVTLRDAGSYSCHTVKYTAHNTIFVWGEYK